MFVAFDKIKELADKQGISINVLEEKLGYGTNTLYRLKRSNPSSKVLKEIADYFGVSADYLLGRTDNPKIADDQNDPAVDNLTKQAIVLFRKETEGLSDSEKERFNTALEGLMKTARQLIQDDSNWK
ncbi:TPA: helix-turn-helix transcriptional regulator [Streptococcus agalactiae]|uniref:helix-turn-helix domain-containing protein n=1 Tax=Streptococcus agalactiae TaxID=1311 RepID=UPI0002BBD095|nr:helix-turn-helix transcriptional regulator [Streptococcus agalactiae]HEP3595842.1 helix-turn-helix transcriptional regulator [Streptococcus pyogenes]EPT97851.1 XRE family transcriptional regulator [Streptococcus agalactiae BSU92]CND60352.1 bacteriophage repressor protein [Streptococcus agalactiae]CNI02212.1 bacteriophage repressor protein [Streptococcus agalactiae]HEN5990782.1 helix-turn-helix transcriptional regulator [Streptococcus agalactiae]